LQSERCHSPLPLSVWHHAYSVLSRLLHSQGKLSQGQANLPNEQQVPKCNAQETIPVIAPNSAESARKAGVHQASLVLLAPCGQEWPEPPTPQSHQGCEPAEEGATPGCTQAFCCMAAHTAHGCTIGQLPVVGRFNRTLTGTSSCATEKGPTF
jgi:hypothetical protein